MLITSYLDIAIWVIINLRIALFKLLSLSILLKNVYFQRFMLRKVHALLRAYINITFILKKVDDSLQSVVKQWTTSNLSEMKRDVEMENMYGMCNYFKNSISRFPFVNSK